jgi:hypothetical protein
MNPTQQATLKALRREMRGLTVLLAARPVEEGNIVRARIAAEVCFQLLDRLDGADWPEPAPILKLAKCRLTY